MTEAWEHADKVAKGMKLLDTRLGPDWVEKIDLSELDLRASCSCVLGQLSIDICATPKTYNVAAVSLFGTDYDARYEATVAHGFDVESCADFPALTQAWNNAIVARRREGAV